MSKIAKVVIELNYDIDSFNETLDVAMTEEEFLDYLEELVPEDLSDLMRGERLKYWSEITLVDKFGEEVK